MSSRRCVVIGAGILGASVAATPFQPGEIPIPNLKPPRGGTAAERDRQMQALRERPLLARRRPWSRRAGP